MVLGEAALELVIPKDPSSLVILTALTLLWCELLFWQLIGMDKLYIKVKILYSIFLIYKC